MNEFKRISDTEDNYKFTALINNIEIILVPQSQLVKVREELDDQLKRDQVWDADKCLEKGLVDEIIKF